MNSVKVLLHLVYHNLERKFHPQRSSFYLSQGLDVTIQNVSACGFKYAQCFSVILMCYFLDTCPRSNSCTEMQLLLNISNFDDGAIVSICDREAVVGSWV